MGSCKSTPRPPRRENQDLHPQDPPSPPPVLPIIERPDPHRCVFSFPPSRNLVDHTDMRRALEMMAAERTGVEFRVADGHMYTAAYLTFFDALARNTVPVTSLVLDSPSTDAYQIAHLARALKTNTTLTRLHVGYIFSDGTVARLVDALQHNTVLRDLRVTARANDQWWGEEFFHRTRASVRRVNGKRECSRRWMRLVMSRHGVPEDVSAHYVSAFFPPDDLSMEDRNLFLTVTRGRGVEMV